MKQSMSAASTLEKEMIEERVRDADLLMHVIANRRSLGLARLKSDPVDRRILEQMLEAANWGQSHGDTEPWRFSVFTGDGRLALGEAFAEAYRRKTPPEEFKQETFDGYRDRGVAAPIWISIGMEPLLLPDGTQKHSDDEEIMAVATAVQNLRLVAASHGLVGMWHSKGPSVDPHVAEFLGLTPPSRLLGFFFCGWPAVEWPEGERRPVAEKVKWFES